MPFARHPKTAVDKTPQKMLTMRMQNKTRSTTKRGFRMKGYELPIISNTAATGHKLQGSSLNKLFVHTWNYSTNWVYVVLSRVNNNNNNNNNNNDDAHNNNAHKTKQILIKYNFQPTFRHL